MTLTIICDVLGEENNGTTIAAMNLIRSMRAKGHTVKVICPDEFRRGEPDYFIAGTLNLGSYLNWRIKKNGVVLMKPDKEVLEKALEGTDAVHLLLPFCFSTWAIKRIRELGLPVTASFHCQAENLTSHLFVMNCHAVNRLVYKTFDRNVYRYVDRIHYPSQFICDTFESEIGHETPRVVISNGVNRAFVPHPEEKPAEYKDRFVILFTGRYSKEKSHSLLIDAANLSKHRDEIQLIFAGSGPLEERIRRRSRKLPNQPLMKFFSREEMIRTINYSDLYVHPAEIELEAIACLEAISCGLVPVINNSPRSATRYFAHSEKNLFRFNDPADLAEKIDWWIEHPAERESCSRSYCGYSRQFDYSHCMDEMERMIEENAEAVNEAR